MNPLRLVLSLFLTVGAMQVQSDDTVTLNGRILANGYQAHSVWIGVFELPMRPEAEAWSWTQLDSTEFTLNVPDAKRNPVGGAAERLLARCATDSSRLCRRKNRA